MKLNELLKDQPEILVAVNSAIDKHNAEITDKDKKVKFVDLSEGQYVGKEKYSSIEQKYIDISEKYKTLETESSTNKTNLDTATKELETLKEKYESEKKSTQESINAKILDLAITSSISGLGVKDKIIENGIRAAIDKSKLSVDENLNVQGLTEQIQSIKDEHKELFAGNIVKVNTGSSTTNSSGKRVYNSLDEISKLSSEEFNADRTNILSQLGRLSQKQ